MCSGCGSALMRSTIACWISVETRAGKRAVTLPPGRCAGVGCALPHRRYFGWKERREVPAIRAGRDASLAASDSTAKRQLGPTTQGIGRDAFVPAGVQR